MSNISNPFRIINFSQCQILSRGDSFKEELNRTDEIANALDGESESKRRKFPSSVNWEVPTSKGMKPTLEELKPLLNFWDDFLSVYNAKLEEGLIQEVKTYKDKNDAFVLLEGYKELIAKDPQDKEKFLIELEELLETQSMQFSEQSILKSSGMLIDKLVSGKYNGESPKIFDSDISVDDVPFTNNMNVHRKVNDEYADEELLNGKEYVLRRLTSQHDICVLNSLGTFTLECLIVYVLSLLCNNLSSDRSHMVPLATLIEKLDTTVRSHAKMESNIGVSNNGDNNGVNTHFHKMSNKHSKYKCTLYPIGVALLEFLVHKDFITLQNKNNESYTGHILIKTKRSRYYRPMPLYVSLNFDRNLLPIMLSLPMVYPPRQFYMLYDDEYKNPPYNDTKVGYFGYVSKDPIEGARLLRTPSMHHYNIGCQSGEQAQDLNLVIKTLQEVPYRINRPWLKTIIKDYDLLVKTGLLLPKRLATMELRSACSILREVYQKNKLIKKLYSYDDILSTLTRNIQKARYERIIIELAEALDGYEIYFPVYLDFRGRIHRSGIFNFHDCDSAKSLLQFAPDHTSPIKGELAGLTSEEVQTLHIATGFHWNKFINNQCASEWYSENTDKISKMLVNNKLNLYYQTAICARHPFQFMANITILHSVQWKEWISGIPIHLEASASAFQTISYLLLEEEMGIQTNLLREDKEDKINEIYLFWKFEVLKYVRNKPELEVIQNLFRDNLDPSLLKNIFMSMIYGKTLHSIAAVINTKLSTLKYEDSLEIAKLCFRFWRERYSEVGNLIKLIRLISSLVANQPVWLSNKYLNTIQDYFCMRSQDIGIHYLDKKKKQIRRKKVTMKVFTNKRDQKKTVNSTFVNFIHLMGASIAMDMVLMAKPIPLYTVHDQFITTAKHCQYLPQMYRDIFMAMEPPIIHVNKFILDNVIVPVNMVFDPEYNMDESNYYYKNIFINNIYKNKSYFPLPFQYLEKYLIYYIRIYIINEDINQVKESWKDHEHEQNLKELYNNLGIPESSKKMIHDIATRYERYVKTTYSDSPIKVYSRKWLPFREKIDKGSNYCLHL